MNIIGTDMVLEVGKTYNDPTYGFKRMPFSSDEETLSQAFLVLRETTVEEFVAQYTAAGGSELGAVLICMEATNFYEISMD